MTFSRRLLPLAAFILIFACKTAKIPSAPLTATITEEGLLTCFAPGTKLQNESVWCEVSAVAYDGQKLLFANDKDMPASLSPVFTKTLATLADSTQLPTYLMPAAYANGRKYEDFTQTPDRKFILLTTAFDRVKPSSTDWDGYNTILYWRTGDEQHPLVLAPDDTSRTSIAYRTRLAQALATSEFPGSVPYFKVEGLAVTDRQFLFGIREVGTSYKLFKPVDKIVAVSYAVEKTGAGERIRLRDDWRVIADFDPARKEASLPRPLSLSSLEYDPGRNFFWMLTSIETQNQLDAYLWYSTPDDLMADKPFTLVRDAAGQPLRFGHKGEDLTILDKNRLLIVHDDDRFQLPVGNKIRQPNQAPYTIITIRQR